MNNSINGEDDVALARKQQQRRPKPTRQSINFQSKTLKNFSASAIAIAMALIRVKYRSFFGSAPQMRKENPEKDPIQSPCRTRRRKHPDEPEPEPSYI